ncbi:unnamed protein product [Heligmosomoides polygyrus]|uniref:Uncharacterized protein n=1 Tax=Heligmosomoides polygyrus TaxID=6339 RepID=A0A3P8ESD1_HELPZ|nr:unnamed protein product [Heligmosomoides polygyrus]
MKEWFGQIQTSDRASLLSKKLQKYAQKRAARTERSSRFSASSSLDVVDEGDGSPEPVPPASNHGGYPCDTGTAAKTAAPAVTTKNPSPPRAEADDSGIATKTPEAEAKASTPSPAPQAISKPPVTSTPLITSAAPKEEIHPALSPIPSSPVSARAMPSDSDDEFFDANSDFNENVQELQLTSSLHEDQLNGNGMLPNDSGISVVRNCMTQSLMKVDEEAPMSQLVVHADGAKPKR